MATANIRHLNWHRHTFTMALVPDNKYNILRGFGIWRSGVHRGLSVSLYQARVRFYVD